MTKTHLAVLRYIRDPVRDEPRNVGVIGWSDGEAIARFLGEDAQGSLDLRRVSTAIIADRQTYSDWIRHLRGLVDRGQVDDPIRQRTTSVAEPEFLESLAGTARGNYDLRLGAEAYVGPGSPLRSVVSQAYQRLVDENAPATPGNVLMGNLDELEAVTLVRSHRELAHHAYLELKRHRLEEERDFVRHYQVFGETAKGSAVPAVFDFGVVPKEGGLFPRGRKLLIDAISLNVSEEEAPAVIDRARAIASKAVEIRKKDEGTDVHALVSNGTSRSSEVGRYALSVLRDEAELTPVDLSQMMDLVVRFKNQGF